MAAMLRPTMGFRLTFSGTPVKHTGACVRVQAPARAQPVLAMAKPTKAADFRSLSEEDIMKAVDECKRALFDLRFKKSSKQEIKTSDFTMYKRKIAQLLTVRRERQIEAGVDRREARRLEKHKRIADGYGNF